jgi:hypothetical protein
MLFSTARLKNKLRKAFCLHHAGFLLGILFITADGGSIFLGNNG